MKAKFYDEKKRKLETTVVTKNGEVNIIFTFTVKGESKFHSLLHLDRREACQFARLILKSAKEVA